MAQKEFLEGEITERFLVDGEETLPNEDGQVALMTPTIIVSIMYCPALTALSYAYCTG